MTTTLDESPRPPERIQAASTCAATIARELGLPTVAARVENETARRLEHQRLRVLVLGEINHGKSTLINALLGQAVLPMGVMPTTSAIVSVRQGDRDELWAHVPQHPPKALDLKLLDDVVRGRVAVQDAWRYELVSPSFALPAAVELVDTPGFNDLSRFRSLLSAGELAHADIYVLALDGTQALTATEHDLVSRALEAAGGFAKSGAQLWVALNRADLLSSPEDRAAVQSRVRLRLSEMGIDPQLMVFCAAKAALRGGQTDPVTDGVHQLRQRLHEVAQSRQQILPQRAQSEVLAHVRYLQTLADVHARALRLQADEAHQQLDGVRARLHASAGALADVRAQIDSRTETLSQTIRATLATIEREVIDEMLAPIDRLDMQQLTGYFPGAAREEIVERCAQASLVLKQELDTLVQMVIAASSDLASRQIADARAALRVETAPLFVPSSSLGIDVMSIALGILGTVMMSTSHVPLGISMTIAAPLANFGLREKAVRDTRKRVREALPTAVRLSVAATQDVWLAAVATVAQRLREALTLGHAQLHAELLQTLEAAQQAVVENGRDLAIVAANRRLQALAQLELELQTSFVPPTPDSTGIAS